ncbi:hypothetical protein ACMD2_10799 [Ananas comosus]|uniref:Uncharacterized protein n=1 Tax=Ananas comosus TaxID=4615 RepID=A0A199VSF5_ANACO|nr:hypothetical protein ACMD2_10799 [Ananas comosus]
MQHHMRKTITVDDYHKIPTCSLIIVSFLCVVVHALCTNFFIVLLEGSQVLARLRKFTLLHAFADIPVHERPLGIHEVELVVDTRENLSDCSVVADHAHGALHLGQVAPRDDSRWLVLTAAHGKLSRRR